MKWFEKKMSGFSIIYLHDPTACFKCVQKEKYDEMYRQSQNEIFEPRKKFIKRKKNFVMPPPISEPESSEESDFEFRKPFDNLYPVKKIRVLKKKNLSNNSSKTLVASSKDSPKKSNFSKSVKKSKAQEIKQGNSGKKQCFKSGKNKGAKIPGKGTLKRKRWFVEKLNDNNDNYEDDMFADRKFGHFQNLLEDETDSCEKYESLETPVFPFSISPRADTPSPTYKDCYSPSELNLTRKGVEEYNYRMGKRRKIDFPDKKNDPAQGGTSRGPGTDVEKTLEAVARILTERQNQFDRANRFDKNFQL